MICIHLKESSSIKQKKLRVNIFSRYLFYSFPYFVWFLYYIEQVPHVYGQVIQYNNINNTYAQPDYSLQNNYITPKPSSSNIQFHKIKVWRDKYMTDYLADLEVILYVDQKGSTKIKILPVQSFPIKDPYSKNVLIKYFLHPFQNHWQIFFMKIKYPIMTTQRNISKLQGTSYLYGKIMNWYAT